MNSSYPCKNVVIINDPQKKYEINNYNIMQLFIKTYDGKIEILNVNLSLSVENITHIIGKIDFSKISIREMFKS